uniref:Uncharacterized protein n=1 Tax=Neogobius melanostomus TaxID=47308 RepID=A0A8C6S7T2_9GOBI
MLTATVMLTATFSHINSFPYSVPTGCLFSVKLHLGCLLPTCLTANLGSNLQTGDETAGKSTSDPFGNGKK